MKTPGLLYVAIRFYSLGLGLGFLLWVPILLTDLCKVRKLTV
jgi:hypothetical protein